MAEAKPALPRILQLRYGPTAVVFISSGCIMVLEIVAGRLIGGYLGTSLYTWTSVIGVVLGGIATGNWLGGKLADRFSPARLLGLLLIGGALVSIGILGLNALVRSQQLFSGLTWPIRIALSVTFIFFAPSCALGTISPVVMTAALQTSQHTGRTVGNLYAAGASGSIVGTFLTGFILIGQFGTTSIVWGVAGTLGLLALTMVVKPKEQLAAALITGLGLGTSVAVVQERGWITVEIADEQTGKTKTERLRYEVESDYFDIVVVPSEYFGGKSALRYEGSLVLLLDAMVHGFIIPGKPELLEYDYAELEAAITRRVVNNASEIRTLTIGGGSYTNPRYYEALYPGSMIDVVEIDPAVTEAAHEALGLPRDTSINSYHVDARLFLNDLPADKKYDVIYGDAFAGFSVPWHLTTLEFTQQLKAALTPKGAYLMNLIDGQDSQLFLGASYNTLSAVFENVTIFGLSGNQNRETFVIYASDFDHDLSGLTELDGRALRAYKLDDARVAEVERRSNGLILTDDYAPVDNLTAPIYASRRKF